MAPITFVRVRGFIAAVLSLIAALVFLSIVARFLGYRLPFLSAISDRLGF